VACNVRATSAWLKHAQLDGVAAIPPRMYGDWSEKGEQCITNRNICYELTNQEGKTFTVAIVGRCGGYSQCGGAPSLKPDQYDYVTLLKQSKILDTTKADANACNTAKGYIAAGTTPACNVTAFPESTWSPEKCFKYGAKNAGTNVDWCASNMHPHFDLNRGLQDRFCGKGVGACTAKSVKPVVCPVYDKQVQQGHLDSEKACGRSGVGFDCRSPAGKDKCNNVRGGICCADYLPNKSGKCAKELPQAGGCATETTCQYTAYACKKK